MKWARQGLKSLLILGGKEHEVWEVGQGLKSPSEIMVEPRPEARSRTSTSLSLYSLFSLDYIPYPVEQNIKRQVWPRCFFSPFLGYASESITRLLKTRVWFSAPVSLAPGSWTSHITSLKPTSFFSEMGTVMANIYWALTCAMHSSKYFIWNFPLNPPTNIWLKHVTGKNKLFSPRHWGHRVCAAYSTHTVSDNGCET